MYEEQRNWPQALENYQQGIVWNIKTGNEYGLGITYHQIGRIYEEQADFAKAKKYFVLAVENLTKFQPHNLEVAQASLARIEAALHPST